MTDAEKPGRIAALGEAPHLPKEGRYGAPHPRDHLRRRSRVRVMAQAASDEVAMG